MKLFSILLLSALALGCGGGRPSLVEVTGTVTLDGEPLEGAIVAFQPARDGSNEIQRPASGITDAQGKFTLGTYGKEDGVPQGEYLVGIQKRELQGELPEDYNLEMPDAVPLKYLWITPRAYADPASSGLTAEVTSSGLEPSVFAIETGGSPPEVELTGPQQRLNEP